MRHLGRLLVVAVVLGALAVTATPSGAATGITPGTFAVGQYVPSGCSTIRGVALATVPPACPVGTLRANNPGAILLGYLKGGTCGRSDCPTDPHSAEYAHAPNGSRINQGADGNTPNATQSPPQSVQILSPISLQKVQVGQVVPIQWQIYPTMARNDTFADQLKEAGFTPEHRIYFICRSGQRSFAAAQAAQAAGFPRAYNVADGFEGGVDAAGHRGAATGWKAAGLPWRQR